MIDISNKNPVKDYGKPKTLPSAKYCTQIYFINLAHEQIYWISNFFLIIISSEIKTKIKNSDLFC